MGVLSKPSTTTPSVAWTRLKSTFGRSSTDSVSYTHLDVYKRQLQSLARLEHDALGSSDGDGLAGAGVDALTLSALTHLEGCLLYTSHTSLHSVHSFRGPRRAQPFLQGKTASPQL